MPKAMVTLTFRIEPETLEAFDAWARTKESNRSRELVDFMRDRAKEFRQEQKVAAAKILEESTYAKAKARLG